MTTWIIIVEDDPMAAKVLGFALEDEGYRVQAVATGRAAIEAVIGREIALVIADVHLPDINGFMLCSELRTRHFTGPILLISAEGTLDAKVRGFNAGADDYVTKPVDLLELLARVNNLVRRFQMPEGPNTAIVRVGSAVLSIGTLTYVSDDVDGQLLTPTEMRLIEYLMRRPGQTVSRDALIQHVWSGDVGDDTNRIDVYIRRLRQKIERSPVAPRYFRTVRGVGYAFQEPGHLGPDGGTSETLATAYHVDPQDVAGAAAGGKPLPEA